MEMDGSIKEFEYFHFPLKCWNEVDLLFYESFVVVACVGRYQGL